MTIAQSLLKNTVARTATELINRLGGALFWVMVARFLGLSALGALAYGLALFSFFHTVSTLGLSAVVVRDVARDRSRAASYFGMTLAAGFLLSLAAALVMLGASGFTATSGDAKAVAAILAVALIPASIFFWSKAILSAAEQMASIALARLAENLFKVTAGIGLLVWNGDVFTMAAVIVGSKSLSALFAFWSARRLARPNWSMDKNLLRYFSRQLPTFSMTALTNSLFWAAPMILLSRMAGDVQAGLFGAAYKLVDMAISFALAYGGAMFPVASRTLTDKRDTFVALLTGTVKYSLMLTLAVAAGVTMLAEPITLLIFGSDSLGAAPVLRLLIWMIVPFAMVPTLAFTLVSFFQQKMDLLANTAAAIVCIALGLLLVPTLGAFGTAISMLAGTAVFWLVEWIGVRRFICHLPLSSLLWKPLLGAILMAAILNINLNPLYTITLAGSIYILFLILSKALSKHELRMIQKLKSA